MRLSKPSLRYHRYGRITREHPRPKKTFVNAHPEAIEIGGDLEDYVPWTLIPDLDPTVRDDICFRRTSFSGMCGEVSLAATSVPEFLKRAVEFLNNKVWGTLSTTMVVSEQSLSDPLVAAAVVRTIADLHYGTVTLNGPGTRGFYTMIAGPGAGILVHRFKISNRARAGRPISSCSTSTEDS